MWICWLISISSVEGLPTFDSSSDGHESGIAVPGEGPNNVASYERSRDPGLPGEWGHTQPRWEDILLDIMWGFSFVCFKDFIYLFLAVLDLCCCVGYSLVAASGDCSLVVVHVLLIAVASCWGAQAVGCTGFSNCDSWALERRQ